MPCICPPSLLGAYLSLHMTLFNLFQTHHQEAAVGWVVQDMHPQFLKFCADCRANNSGNHSSILVNSMQARWWNFSMIGSSRCRPQQHVSFFSSVNKTVSDTRPSGHYTTEILSQGLITLQNWQLSLSKTNNTTQNKTKNKTRWKVASGFDEGDNFFSKTLSRMGWQW